MPQKKKSAQVNHSMMVTTDSVFCDAMSSFERFAFHAFFVRREPILLGSLWSSRDDTNDQ